MKLSLILVGGFLLMAAVAVAQQQNMFYWPFCNNYDSRQMRARNYWPEFRAPALMMSPFRNPFQAPDQDDYANDQQFYDRVSEEDEEDGGFEVQQLEGRGKGSSTNRRPHNRFEQRWLSTRSSYTYTTVYSTTQTATSAVVVTCIPATLFKAGSSTVACRRRRQLEEPFIDNDVIAPSHVEKLVPSKLVSMNQIASGIEKREIADSDPLIDSSMINTAPVESSFRSARLFNLFVVSTKTYTVTLSTSYNFVTTTIKSTLNLAAAGQVLCLPSGYQLC